MRKSMLLVAAIAVLVGCSSDTTAPPPIDNTPHVGYFVTVNGSQTGDGSAANPWNLATALAQPGIVQPGDTIWMHGGTYKGNFVSTLTGSANAPVILRQFPGERATVDGRFDINGQYAYYWGFEVTDSDPQRVAVDSGSRPADLPRNMVTVYVSGPFNKIINLVIHDMGDGLYSGVPAQGLEVYGTLVYDNGWVGPDRGHGHGLYLQNQLATKEIIDNVIFDNFSTGLKIGGTAGYLLNFHVEGNSVFLAGAPALASYPYQLNLDQEGGAEAGNSTFDHNSLYQLNGETGSFRLGITGDPVETHSISFTNNVSQGSSSFDTWPSLTFTGNTLASGQSAYDASGPRLLNVRMPTGVAKSNYTINNNSYYYTVAGTSTPGPFNFFEAGVNHNYTVSATGLTSLVDWRAATGWDSNSTFSVSAFSRTDVILRPNRYESGRANITVWNWNGASSASVDVSGILKAGDRFVVHHVYDFYGQPVASGTYSGQPISLPLKSYTPPTPLGMTAPPPSSGSEFNVFIIQKS
ncbi:MAG: hypothetical protein ACRENK_07020 [Gemmatimonadaceae bacterium]